ncbi:hypothetical protein CTA2_10432 [Colletotrichum tanaceti]|nr:hypothetical protein CTA2_10432 [Colletotrichum tanaceti]
MRSHRSSRQAQWVEQQLPIAYQGQEDLKRELDRIFGRNRHHIKEIKYDHYHLVLPRALRHRRIGDRTEDDMTGRSRAYICSNVFVNVSGQAAWPRKQMYPSTLPLRISNRRTSSSTHRFYSGHNRRK